MSTPVDNPAQGGQDGMAAKRPPRRISWSTPPLTNVGPTTSKESVPIVEGTMVGDFRVQRRLDEGGMGTVYLAVHPIIGKKVAIKVLHPHVARQEEAVARFAERRTLPSMTYRAFSSFPTCLMSGDWPL